MITIYTVSSCTSCKKAKTWLNAHQLTYKEQNLGKEGITKDRKWYREHCFIKKPLC